jgi:hypothetical protein
MVRAFNVLGEHRENKPVDVPECRSCRHLPLQHVKLLAKRQDFRLQ